MSKVRTEIRDAIGIITLDHPARRNALSAELVSACVAALADFRERRVPQFRGE